MNDSTKRYPLLTFDLREPEWVVAQIRVLDGPPTDAVVAMSQPLAAQIKFPRPPYNMKPVPLGAFFLRDGTRIEVDMSTNVPNPEPVLSMQDAFEADWGEGALSAMSERLMTAAGVIAVGLSVTRGELLPLIKFLSTVGQQMVGSKGFGLVAGNGNDNTTLKSMPTELLDGLEVCSDCGGVHPKEPVGRMVLPDVDPHGEVPADTAYVRVDMFEVADCWVPARNDGHTLAHVTGLKLMVPVGDVPTWHEGVTDKGFVERSGCIGRFEFARAVMVQDDGNGNYSHLVLQNYPVFVPKGVTPALDGHTITPACVFATLVDREATPDELVSTEQAREMVTARRTAVEASPTVQ